MARCLELENWEQNYCLSTIGETAHAPLMANEMPSSNAFSQRSSFSRSDGLGQQRLWGRDCVCYAKARKLCQ